MSLIIHFLTKDGIVAISDKRTTVDKDKKKYTLYGCYNQDNCFS